MITPGIYIRLHILEMSQTELAKALGVSQPTVSNMERAEKVPEQYWDALRSLARKEGVELTDRDFTKPPLKKRTR